VFTPYFVAGAIYSGFAMVITLLLPLRSLYGMKDLITDRHLQAMAKVMLATGLIVAYGYVIEKFIAWYSGNPFELFLVENRLSGPYSFQYYTLWVCNILVPQLLWIKRLRSSPVALWIIAMFVNVGMWLERYVIVVLSLHRDFLPSSWDMYAGTIWDWAIYIGTIGFFLACMFLFVRFLPMIAMFEMRHLVHEKKHSEAA
jgi:molybdopterin-containing oxidoreductase family membrane subunit